MATDFTAVVDASQVINALGSAQDQMPYAMAQALDLSLYAARKTIASDLSRYFMIRTKFVPRSLHIDRPNKRKLWGRIGFLERVWFMESQVVGDSRRKHPKGRQIWQPVTTGGSLDPRPNPAEAIIAERQARYAGRSREKGGIGYFKILNNISYPGIYYREPGEGRKITPAYWLEDSMDVKPRYPMDKRTIEEVRIAWPAAAIKGVQRALKTRK